MNPLPRWFVAVVIVVAALVPRASVGQEGARTDSGLARLVILHTNDIHGQIRALPDPRSREGTPRLVGGLQELVAAIDEERAKVRHSVLVDAGDWYQGTPEGTLSNGRCSVELMNAAGYDFACLGNHDFDGGPESVLDLLRLARFPVGCRNLRQPSGGPPRQAILDLLAAVAPGFQVSVEGFRVRFEGLLCEEAPRIIAPRSLDGLRVLPEVETAKAVIENGDRPSGDALVFVNHIGKDRNVALARAVRGIDVIIGGHAHGNVLEHGVSVESTGTLIAQAASSTMALGVVTLTIDVHAKKIVKKEARIRRIEPVAGLAVPRVLPIIERYEREVAEKMQVEVADVPAFLAKEGSIEKPSPLALWLTRTMVKATGADVAVHNTGGIRASLPAGKARVREFFQISPFGNRLTLLTMKVKDVLALAERTARNPGRGCVFAGIEIEYSKDADNRYQAVAIRHHGEILKDDQPLRVCTTDFLANGADNMDPFTTGTDRKDLDETLLDATLRIARDEKTIVAPASNPWVPRSR